MKSIKLISTLILATFVSIGLISYFTVSHVNSLRKLKESKISPSNLIPKSTNFIDLNDKKVISEQLRKVLHFKLIEGETVRHLNPKELENDLESNKLRSLETSNEFDDVLIVDPNKESYSNIRNWFIKSMKLFSSNIVVYPYAFNFNHQTEKGSENILYEQGGFISLNPKELDGLEMGLKTDETLKIQKARALFDADIAILSVAGYLEENMTNVDYFADGIDWCSYFQYYLRKGNCQPTYMQFLEQKTKNPNKAYATFMNETELIKGALMNDGLPRFGVLIIPDYLTGTENMILSKLTSQGCNKIKEYYNKGGVIFVTGKSGTLFEDIDLIKKGTYDRQNLLSINSYDRKVSTKGCERTYNQTYNKEQDFNRQMTCLSIKEENKICLSSTFYTKNLDDSFKTLVSIDPEDKNLVLKDIDSGLSRNLTLDEKKNLPLVSHKSNDKNGQIFLMNFNTMFEEGDRNIILNLLSLALSKELYLTSNVTMNINSTENPDIPIPAGEAGFNLEVNTVIHNLNDTNINDCKLYVFLPDNFDWTETPDNCTKRSDFKDLPKSVIQKKTVSSSNEYLFCEIGNISPYQRKNFKITISVLNYKATQMKYQVLILEPIAVFQNDLADNYTLVDYVRVNCEAASLLRTAINPDPSSFYPVKGEGQYIDNVVKVENKEQTSAFDVEYAALIPLISPLVDGSDQRKTVWNLKIYVDYYNNVSNNFEVPLTSNGSYDYVYYAFLRGKGAVIVAEWDSPVQPVKEVIDTEKIEEINFDEDSELEGINLGLITMNKTSEILKQINFRKSDMFYKLASQRLMVFIDDSTPKGANTLYGDLNKIPEDWKINETADRAKREFIFTRLDVYFYNNENYVNPLNVDEKIVFSVDKKLSYEKKKEGCVNIRGDARSKIIEPGFFTNLDKNNLTTRNTILKPNIYSNELFEYCDLNVIDPTKDDLASTFGNNIRLVHYLIPNVEKDITHYTQIYDFVKENEYSGHHKDYEKLKFLYVHTYDLTINSTTCIYGGKIIIYLNIFKETKIEDITISPDQIAIYNIEKEDDKIIAYFRRGLMSNEQFGKNLGIKINIENLNSRIDVSLDVEIQEMKYDISYPPSYERYTSISKNSCKFEYKTAWSFPALEIKAKLNRTLNGYETIEPFSRYGVYIQELYHRYVFGTAETHFEKKPGIVGNGSGFSLISNLGISSIPFIEYVTVGRGQVIPAGPSTSRITWTDIWGRIWHQPLRSVFPDVPPLPGPLKNFMMTTTYEILKDGNQIYEWPSDENVKIHLHIKLLNNYQKFFEITRCKNNQILFVPENLGDYYDLVFDNKCSVELNDEQITKNNVFLRQGGYASYGSCYTEEGVIVEGQIINETTRDLIKKAKVCADSTTSDEIKQCERELKDIPTVHRVDKNSKVKGKKWNYSPSIENYYPTGYIEDDMWDLTHVDYDDTNMVKAHPYHMDNHLPNYDNTIIKPHNTIAIPIYKGLGYSITYDKTNSMNYHGVEKHGWWGDNLQNKDDTLLAGQTECNNISVDKKSSIKWVKGEELNGYDDSNDGSVKEIIKNRNKNIYVCLYNRKRPYFDKNTNKKYYSANVNENNIVPIIVDLDKDDERLSNYECTGNQYTPENLYQLEDNLLVTPTSKDYLYFAANLRGQAKESFNVLMNLNNFDKIKYEGMIKVNEGGRFVYWNPANGPNSFLIVDDPVSIVNAKRNDIEISNSLFPINVDTFDSVVYHIYNFKDENKINKIWPFSEFYTNSYGFGDVAVSVYIGGIRKSKALVQPGQTTYAKIIFYNNCGFDWNMKGNAIDFEYKGSKSISANDLLSRIVHTIRLPLEYNFLKYSVDDEYKQYIKIKPSDHNIEVAPEFFDFENINVVTIRDGFKGEYNLQINITEDFPDELRGKPIEIKIELDSSYFDHFPGTNTDPIKNYHKYNVKVPSAYIGVPYKDGEFKGKVLYTSAQASDLDLSFNIGVDWKIDGVKYTNQEMIDKMLDTIQNFNSSKGLEQLWNELGQNTINFKEAILNPEMKKVSIEGIKKDYPLFPKIIKGAPDIADITILIKSTVKQLPFGTTYPINQVKMKYKKWTGGEKEAEGESPFIIAQGPWIILTLKKTLVELLPNGTFVNIENSTLTHEMEGYLKIQFTLENRGNKNSYNTRYQIPLEQKIKYHSCSEDIEFASSKDNSNGGSTILFDLKAPVNKREKIGGIIYVQFYKYIESYSSLTPDEIDNLPAQLIVAKESAVIIDLTKNNGEKEVVQYLRVPLAINYIIPKGPRVYMDLIVSGKRKSPTVEIKPKVDSVEDFDSSKFNYRVVKVDYTNYNSPQNELKRLKENDKMIYEGKLDKASATDKPNIIETDNKKHYVSYKCKIYNQTYYNSNKYSYKQEEIGMSTLEKSLIGISFSFFVIGGIFIILAVRNCRLLKNKDLEKEIAKTGKIDKLLEDK